jgi:hypothetical protein
MELSGNVLVLRIVSLTRQTVRCVLAKFCDSCSSSILPSPVTV